VPETENDYGFRIAVGHVTTLAKVFAFAATFGVAVVAARAFGVNHVGPLCAAGSGVGHDDP